jgi:hypothetical protein
LRCFWTSAAVALSDRHRVGEADVAAQAGAAHPTGAAPTALSRT